MKTKKNFLILRIKIKDDGILKNHHPPERRLFLLAESFGARARKCPCERVRAPLRVVKAFLVVLVQNAKIP